MTDVEELAVLKKYGETKLNEYTQALSVAIKIIPRPDIYKAIDECITKIKIDLIFLGIEEKRIFIQHLEGDLTINILAKTKPQPVEILMRFIDE